MIVPRITIAGTHSGAGKTSVTLALMTAFKNAGMRVQGFKVGPDYIDPSYHKIVTGTPSHNLDSWLLSPETIQWLFQEKSKSADISVIEGVMGLFDGFNSKDDLASTAQMAKWLGSPVLLVLDAQSMSRSAAAIVLGYKSFDPDLNISGIILNKVGSARHLKLLQESIEFYTKVPVLGAIHRDTKLQIPQRHLGLTTAEENMDFKSCLDSLSAIARKPMPGNQSWLDIQKLQCLTSDVPAKRDPTSNVQNKGTIDLGLWTSDVKKVRIAYAYDRAFNFYYQANLDLLTQFGAELIPFSPLEDESLPKAVRGLYFGGGFPEIYAEQLANNIPLKQQIRKFASSGLAIYAECGGLMYLSESIQTLQGKTYPMIALVPGNITMTNKLQSFGYKEGTILQNNILGCKGESLRGHEFHYSSRSVRKNKNAKFCYELTDRKTENKQLEGFAKKSIMASYVHLHFLTQPEWAKRFIEFTCRS